MLFRISKFAPKFKILKMDSRAYTDINFKIRAKNKVYEGLEKEKGSSWEGPFYFVQAADTQFGMIESYIEKKSDPRWDKEIELTKKAISAVNKMNPKPKFFIVCGDLIDAFPFTPLRTAQEQDFKKVFAELDSSIPLVCICGNHDVGNTPTSESIEDYKSKFGDDYFVFWCGGVMCIVLNSQFYKDPSEVKNLASAHDKWLDEKLLEATAGNYNHIFIFQHIPWFLKESDEDDEYFNITLDLRMKMLNKFKKAGVSAIFCGHYHRNAGGFYKNMEEVVTSAVGAQLGNDKSGFRIVKVFEKSYQHNYYSLEDLPEKIHLN
ncbi:serine/threonine-protein phosphatase CPPED1-like [Centruroides vittatus]|uniref:serine/threonine-protein phosphatase CPPED1-like n=1 Tax=Centruroides vittatus TaxID=120091 RepID=UPI00351021DC